MPMLTIATNVPSSSIPNGFLEEASKMFQQAIGKPMQPQQMLMFGGTNDPCAFIRVESIGKLGVEENKVLSKTIFDFIKEKLGIEGTRAYINFTDLSREIVGYKGTTFHELAKGK